jgi:hypothetical protein
MSTIRIAVACTEFDRSFTAGQLVSDLSGLQETAMVLSGLAAFQPGGQTTAIPDEGVIPITSVQLASPQSFGLATKSRRTFECDGARYFWGTSGWAEVGSRRQVRTGVWYPVRSVTMRLLLNGAGTVTVLGRGASGGAGTAQGDVINVTAANQVVYAYPGDESLEYSLVLTGTVTAQEV